MSYVTATFVLPKDVCEDAHRRTVLFGFNGFGEAVYHRTYSRLMADGRQEQWADTCIRVVEGVMAIRKTHLQNHGLCWNEAAMQARAIQMLDGILNMRWLPPGRGLWAMGTDYVRERGALSLYNCAATEVTRLSDDAAWLMDCSMCGVGVGFSTVPRAPIHLEHPWREVETYVVPDSREGWVESVRRLIASYEEGPPNQTVVFDYSRIRPAGAPIKGFGGVCSGYEPLMTLHERLRRALDAYASGLLSTTRLIADVMNAIGVCVVAGNVRRSAELALGRVDDDVFVNLKNPIANPDRQDIAWMSNNSVVLESHEDFLALPRIAERIVANGEPGFFNLKNIQRFGRLFREAPDAATLANPCSEIPLEDKEVCNLVEVFPTRCASPGALAEAFVDATFYASTVALLPTHRPETNAVVARNRRIGVSISGVADWIETTSQAHVTRVLRDGYNLVRETNALLAREAGVPTSVRVTTVKPSGSISQLAGVSSGMHWPTFRYAVRRMRVGEHAPIVPVLLEAGVPWEPDVKSDKTLVFEFPIDQGRTRPAREVSMWQQASRVAMLQREWADNMVSNTIYFDPATEAHDVEHLLSEYAPVVKSMSVLPHTEEGAYAQMPYEGIGVEEYERRRAAIRPLRWDGFAGSDGEDDRFCTNDVCTVPWLTGATTPEAA